MTFREIIEDALIVALEHYSPPAEFRVTLEPAYYARIRGLHGAVFRVPEHAMTIGLDGPPEPPAIH